MASQPRRNRPSRGLSLAVLLLLTGCDDPRGEIRRVLREERWVKPRISLDHAASVCPLTEDRSVSMACGGGEPRADALRRLAAIAKRDPTSTRLPIAALLGRPFQVGLRPAERTSSDQWADLAAAELLQASRSGNPRQAWQARQAAQQALDLDPSNRRAFFNLALAYEHLFLDEAALETWNRYLEVEPEHVWRQEAAAHLERLNQPTVQDDWKAAETELNGAVDPGRLQRLSSQFVFEIRQLFLEQYVARWTTEPVNEALCCDSNSWPAIGEAHRAVTGDSLIAETVAWLTREFCGPRSSSETREAIASTVRALELYDRSDSAASHRLMARARPRLEATESPLLALVDLYSAINVFALNRYAEAQLSFEALEPELLARGFLFLGARAAWLQGTIALRNQDLAGAIDHYRRAQGVFDRMSDLSYGTATRGLIAETLARMGVFDQAWTAGLAGLRQARHLGQEQRLYTSCSLLAIVAALEGTYDLAAEFQECALKHVRTLTNDAAETDVLLWQAVWLHRANRREHARRSLDKARRSADRIADEDERRQAIADLALIEGALDWEESPRSALRNLALAIDFFDEIGHHYYASDARLLQASAAHRTGDVALAEESLLQALWLHERFRVGDSNPESRLAMLQKDQSIYDRLVRFYLDGRPDPWRALIFADRGKKDRYSPSRTETRGFEKKLETTRADWQSALDALPRWVTIASYQLLADELVTWVLRPGHAPEMSRASVTTPAFPPIRQESLRGRSWSALLSAPLRDRVTTDGLLVIVADKQLNGFPAALLTPNADGLPVIQTAAVVVATSVEDFLMGEPARRRSATLDSAQAFLGPRLPRVTHELPPLTPSRLEAAALTETFRDVEIWEAGEATAGRFLASIRRPGIVHFSGHVEADEQQPLESALLFSADSSRPDGRVTARELYALGPSQVSLVSLAGCGSGAAPRSLPLSLTLVRPFLSSGTPAVLGSLKPLSDDFFVRFITAFYRQLGDTRSVLLAFRDAQRQLVSDSPDGDLRWAEIQLYATKDILELRR